VSGPEPAGGTRTAYIAGLGTALPGPPLRQQDMWTARFATHFAGDRAAGRIFRGAGVRRRHAAVNPAVEDVSGWSTGARMRRYLTEALPLGKDAVGAAIADAGVRAEDIGLFAVASCTGYATPGLDIRIAADLGMAAGLQRLVVGHMGCYAAIPGLGAVTDYVVSRRRPAVLLCCELTSLHVQPPTDDRAQVVAHALFGDAAAAVVVVPERPRRRPALLAVDVIARTDASTADHMTWDVTDLGFRMGLSPEVPRVLARQVRGLVTDLLQRNGITIGDVDAWAVHPGGPRILDTVTDRLDLPAAALDASRAVLAERGNCSSTTVLLVLDALREAGRPRAGRPAVVMAFGPGLTLYAALLRAQ
jgi:alkylresorcinol/alkylpyrone synthase